MAIHMKANIVKSFGLIVLAISLISGAGFSVQPDAGLFHKDRFLMELGIGFHQPQANYTKYVDNGLSLRWVISSQDYDFPYIRYDGELHYLGFKNDVHWENLDYQGNPGPSIRVKNSEQSLGFLIGPRLMSPTRKGAIRPYIGIKGGFFVFFETITWEWEDNNWHWFDEEDDDDNSYTDVIDSEFHLGWMLEIGSNVTLKSGCGLDFGIQYTVIPGITRPEVEVPIEDEMTFDDVSKTIDADYVSFYIGISLRNPFEN